MQKLISKSYFWAIVKFVAFCVRWATARGRVVQYAISARCQYGQSPAVGRYICPCGACSGREPGSVYMTRYVLFGHMTGDAPSFWKKWLPAVYVNCIHKPDHDESVHNHPWPWAITFGLLGEYREMRVTPWDYLVKPAQRCVRRAPFCYLLRRKDWHRISGTTPARAAGQSGVWTLFVAAPRAFSKPWGYLVPGRGYVDQRERHAEIGATEARAR